MKSWASDHTVHSLNLHKNGKEKEGRNVQIKGQGQSHRVTTWWTSQEEDRTWVKTALLLTDLVFFSEYHVHVFTWVLIGDRNSTLVLLGGLGTNTGGTGTTPLPPPRMQPPRSVQWASSLSGQLRHCPLGNSMKLMLHNYLPKGPGSGNIYAPIPENH